MSVSKSFYRGVILAAAVTVATSLTGCVAVPDKPKLSEAKEKELVNTYISTAGIYLKRGQLQYVKEKVDKAMALEPDNPDVNNMMALYQWRIKQNDEADKYFRKAIHADPKNPESLNNYGVFLCETGKVDDAVKYYDRAVAVPVYPARAQAYTNAAKCLVSVDDFEKAEVYFANALQVDPYFPEAALGIAKIEARNGRLVEARKHIKNYFFKGRKTPESVYLALRIEESLGNKKQAADYALELMSKFPDSQEATWVKNRMTRR
jgi:type IV pilus assembly protein PilF